MGNREQWVNLPSEDETIARGSFVGDGPASVPQVGRAVYIEAKFDREDAVEPAVLHVIPGGDNAPAPDAPAELAPQSAAPQGGVVRYKVDLSSAGGDTFEFKVEDTLGTSLRLPEVLETRRLLYYEVVKMCGVELDTSPLTAQLEREFWNPAKKHFIKLIKTGETSSPHGLRNYDEHQEHLLPGHVREARRGSTSPYSFIIAFIDQNAASHVDAAAIDVAVNPDGSTEPCETHRILWQDLDPSGSDGARWLIEGFYRLKSGGRADWIPVDPSYFALDGGPGTKRFRVLPGGLPPWTRGTLHVVLKEVQCFWGGMSLHGMNVICVAARARWEPNPLDILKAAIVHEAGHKIGLVPSSQSSYYERNGGHCDHGGDACVMYEAVYVGAPDRFCPVCNETVRGSNLDGRSLPHFKPL